MKPIHIALICIAALLLLLLVGYLYIRFYNGHNRFIQSLRFKLFKNKVKNKKYDAYYSVKARYISPCEQDYFEIIKSCLSGDFVVFPQVPLSQIVEKHSQANYKTELFRVIDFCVFDSNYRPILCIEINDKSHVTKSRAKRDESVSKILKSANLPIVTFWTYEGLDYNLIKKRLKPFGVV